MKTSCYYNLPQNIHNSFNQITCNIYDSFLYFMISTVEIDGFVSLSFPVTMSALLNVNPQFLFTKIIVTLFVLLQYTFWTQQYIF